MNTIVRSMISTALGATPTDFASAQASNARAPYGWTGSGVYAETEKRRAMRALLDAAGNTGATLKLGFMKVGGDMRYMLARPSVGADGTCKYYTVLDRELSEKEDRPVYRRVNLDAIVAATIEFHAAEGV